MEKPSVHRLLETLSYDPITGDLSWKIRKGRIKQGQKILCKNWAGYILVRVDYTLFRAHRVIWAMQTGDWPDDNIEIDHINGIKHDNRWANLRLATISQNSKNLPKPKTNKSGYKGVSWHKAGKKWQAHIKSDGINYYLGLFETKIEAHEAYKQASAKLHKDFFNHG